MPMSLFYSRNSIPKQKTCRITLNPEARNEGGMLPKSYLFWAVCYEILNE